MATNTSTKMSEKRMGEITLILVKKQIRQERIPLDPAEVRRRLGDKAKEFGISLDEAMQFTEMLLSEAFAEMMISLQGKGEH